MRTTVFGVIAALMSCPPAHAQFPDSWGSPRELSLGHTASGDPFVEGEIVVCVEAESSSALLAEVHGKGDRLLGEIPSLGVLRIELTSGRDEVEAANAYGLLPGVAYAELNGVVTTGGASCVPADTFFGQQYHLENTGQLGGRPGADIEALQAWAIEPGSPEVVLAIIDTGIDFDHPEFAGRLLPGYDFADNDPDPTANTGHGVRVTGIAAASANNAFQVAGVDGGCTILPLKVFGNAGFARISDVVEALVYCADVQADVINMSLIGAPASNLFRNGLAAARDAGCILVACAGNGGMGNADTSWPGASPDTISIAHLNRKDQRVGQSATGAALDFTAPGVNVGTVYWQTNPGSVFEDRRAVMGGCSAATPVAAGILCLLKAREPTLTQSRAIELLIAGAEDGVGAPGRDTPGWDEFFGHGRLNAARSLRAQAGLKVPVRIGIAVGLANAVLEEPCLSITVLGNPNLDVRHVSTGGLRISRSDLPCGWTENGEMRTLVHDVATWSASDNQRLLLQPDGRLDLELVVPLSELADLHLISSPPARGESLEIWGRLEDGTPFTGESRFGVLSATRDLGPSSGQASRGG